jgi:DNA helicase-2/ATP-dependent DNA helicase PcrA
VKDLVCALRLVVNPSDELAWFRVLQLIDGIGPATARKLAPLNGAIDLPSTEELLVALEDARRLATREGPGAAVERLRVWLEPIIERHHANAAARIADLDALGIAAASAPSLERFLTELVLDPPSSTGELAGTPHLDDDWLTLSTIHSAKGGEWDAVHVIHLAEGSLPSDMATGNDEEIEEERRLLYVAMTRARDRLWCYVPLRYHVGLGRAWWSDRHSYSQRSRFLTDAVVATMDREGDPAGRADNTLTAPGTDAPLADVDALVSSLLD